METDAQRHAARHRAGGKGSFDDINPELPQKRHLLLQEGGVESEEEEPGSLGVRARRRRKHKGAASPPRVLLPPLHGGGGPLLLQLKGLREALPHGQVEVEAGGARSLWRAVFSGNRKEEKRGGTSPAGAERANQRTAAGDDVIKRCGRQRVPPMR